MMPQGAPRVINYSPRLINYAPREHLWSWRDLHHYDFKISIVFMVPYIGEMSILFSKTYMWDTSGQDYKKAEIFVT
jgi:hypothetical protein